MAFPVAGKCIPSPLRTAAFQARVPFTLWRRQGRPPVSRRTAAAERRYFWHAGHVEQSQQVHSAQPQTPVVQQSQQAVPAAGAEERAAPAKDASAITKETIRFIIFKSKN